MLKRFLLNCVSERALLAAMNIVILQPKEEAK